MSNLIFLSECEAADINGGFFNDNVIVFKPLSQRASLRQRNTSTQTTTAGDSGAAGNIAAQGNIGVIGQLAIAV